MLVSVYMRPVRKFSSDRSHQCQVVDRHECDEQGKHCCWELMKTLNVVRNIGNNVALVSFRFHVNTLENLHIGSSLNSYRFHVNGT